MSRLLRKIIVQPLIGRNKMSGPVLDDDLKKLKADTSIICTHIKLAIEKLDKISESYKITTHAEEDIVGLMCLLEDAKSEIGGIADDV